MSQRLRDLHLLLGQQVNKLEGVYDRLRLKMIVGDHEGGARPRCNLLDPLGPRIEFLLRIKVVVAFFGRTHGIIAEPSIVAAAVQTNVSYRRRGLLTRPDGPADNGLVDIAKSDAALVQEFVEFLVRPGFHRRRLRPRRA
jgi:hypothetical protein